MLLKWIKVFFELLGYYKKLGIIFGDVRVKIYLVFGFFFFLSVNNIIVCM